MTCGDVRPRVHVLRQAAVALTVAPPLPAGGPASLLAARRRGDTVARRFERAIANRPILPQPVRKHQTEPRPSAATQAASRRLASSARPIANTQTRPSSRCVCFSPESTASCCDHGDSAGASSRISCRNSSWVTSSRSRASRCTTAGTSRCLFLLCAPNFVASTRTVPAHWKKTLRTRSSTKRAK